MAFIFGFLFFATPLVFFPQTSEVFEFNKITLVYLITIIIAGFWLLKMISQRKIIFRRTILDWPLVFFLTSQILSTILSVDSRTSLLGYYSRFHGGLLSSVSYAILYWAFVANVSQKEIQKIIKIALAAGLVISLYAILEHFGYSVSCLIINHQFNASCWVQDVQARVFATLGQPNWLAAYLVALLPLVWVQALQKSKSKNKQSLRLHQQKTKVSWFVISTLFFLALLFTKSRSGILGFLVADFLFWALVLWKYKKEFVKQFVTLNLIFGIAALAFGTPWSAPPSQGPALEGGGTESGQIRKIVWRGAIDIWKAYPVFGTGPETFAYTYYQFRPQEHNLVSEWDFLYNKAHNEYLNTLANTGIIGLLSYLTVVGFSFFIFFKNWKLENLALAAGYASILVTNFFGFSVVVTGLMIFLFPAMAVSLEPKSKKVNKFKWPQIGVVIFLSLLPLYSLAKYWYADLLYAQGRQQNKLTQPLAAAKKLEKAVSFSPKEPLFHDELAKAYSTLAVYFWQEDASTSAQLKDAALTETQIATSLSPRNVNLKRSQVNIVSELSATDQNLLLQSLPVFEELKILAPTDAKIFYTLGMTYEALGERQKAIETLEKAIILKPNYDKARFTLALLYKDENRLEEAKNELKYILENHLAADEEPIKEELKKLEIGK